MKKIVVFDVDGVVADYEEKIVFAINEKFGPRIGHDRSLYSLEERYSTQPNVLEYCQSLTNDPNFYYSIRPNQGAIELAKILIEEGYDVVFASARPVSCLSVTKRWLGKHLKSQGHSCYCGVENKSGFMAAMFGDIAFAVDDNPAQIKSIANAGYVALCWDNPWNEGIFPRLYYRTDGVVMLWESPDEEAMPFIEEASEEIEE